MLKNWIFSTLILSFVPLMTRVMTVIFGPKGIQSNFQVIDPIDFIVLTFIINGSLVNDWNIKQKSDLYIDLSIKVGIISCFFSGAFLMLIYYSILTNLSYNQTGVLIAVIIMAFINVFMTGSIYYKFDKNTLGG